MSGIKNLVGPSVLSKAGLVDVDDVCKDKTAIGLYFSAHWCPPCIGFTPKLANYYDKIKDSFEIIFVSFDEDEDCFQEYYTKMPWFALPFDSEKKDMLGKQFGVHGIPVLVVVDANGQLITTDGRTDVIRYCESGGFPKEWSK